MGLPIIGRLLGHTQASTTQRYAHLDADPLRRASNAIGASIAAAMGEAGRDWRSYSVAQKRNKEPAGIGRPSDKLGGTPGFPAALRCRSRVQRWRWK